MPRSPTAPMLALSGLARPFCAIAPLRPPTLGKLSLAANEARHLQGGIAFGDVVTYIFGSFAAIIVYVDTLPRLKRRSIREDAIKVGATLSAPLSLLVQNDAVPPRDFGGHRTSQESQAIDPP